LFCKYDLLSKLRDVFLELETVNLEISVLLEGCVVIIGILLLENLLQEVYLELETKVFLLDLVDDLFGSISTA